METKLLHLSLVPVAAGDPGLKAIKGELFAGKHEVRLAKSVGVTQFGVNHITLDPGSISALRHWHEAEDEFVYVLAGELTLIDDNGEHPMAAGAFVGFPAGVANGHHLINKSKAPACFIVVGTRRPGEETIHYPDDDFGPVRKLPASAFAYRPGLKRSAGSWPLKRAQHVLISRLLRQSGSLALASQRGSLPRR